MATTYVTPAQIVSFLKITDNQGELIVPDSGTDPTLAELEDMINEAEEEIDSRTLHTWKLTKVTHEIHDVINVYDYGRGLRIHLFHRNVRAFDELKGDIIEMWNGAEYDNITPQGEDTHILNESMGILALRGFVFSIFRENRLRVTYRYGGEQGDTSDTPTVPADIRDCARKLTAIKILESSFAMSNIEFGADRGMRTAEVVDRWRKDVDDIIYRHAEIVHIEF